MDRIESTLLRDFLTGWDVFWLDAMICVNMVNAADV